MHFEAGVPTRWSETVMLRGIKLSASSMLVFELWMAKPGIAGMPTRERLVAWAQAPMLQQGKVLVLQRGNA